MYDPKPGADFESECALATEIASLESEIARVSALRTTTDANRADLQERLRRLKENAAARP
jgi:predicted  nucleic acid-binding Zn-ribbon protein